MFKDYLIDKTKEFISITEKLKEKNLFYTDFQYLDNNKKEDLEQRYESIRESIEKSINSLNRSLKKFERLEWENLNIAFFGETNAGKSTLLEALISGDGRSIGFGVKDFTKKYKKYHYLKDVSIIDTPGIEGNENEVIQEIKKALNIAHVVFYIFPDNKEPEEKTLEKIKSFLNEQAYIYTIMNIRFTRKNKEELIKRFESENIKIVENGTKEKLRRIFGERFKGLFKVHALYAFYARARGFNPSEDNIIISEEKAKETIENFGGKKELEEISHINDIVNEINKLKENYKTMILYSNTRKILNKQEYIITKLIYNKNIISQYIKELEEALDKYHKKFQERKVFLKEHLNASIREFKSNLANDLKKELSHLIEQEIKDEYSIKMAINSTVEIRKKDLTKTMEKEIQDFQKDMKKELEFLYEKIGKSNNFINKYKVNIDFASIIEKLQKGIKIDIGDVFGAIFTAISFVINPILGIISAIGLAVRKFFDWLLGKKDRKKEAKREAYKQIDMEVRNIEKMLYKEINNAFYQIEKETKNIEKQIKREKYLLKTVTNTLKEIIEELIKINTEIGYNFLKSLDEKVEFGYMQTTIQDGDYIAVVGDVNKIRDIMKICGVNNVYVYKTMADLIIDISNKNGEFFKRLRNFLKGR